MAKNFALVGLAGFVAPRHLQAIRDTGNRLVVAMDPSDSVGVVDGFFPDARFFTEIERFDRHLEKLRRLRDEQRIDYVSVCSPNYLHDAHVRLALRVGADAICEKPLVINPWNLDQLAELERETGSRVFSVLQLRHHPDIQRLRAAMRKRAPSEVELTCVTRRGAWYDISWKGDEAKSGGVVMNIGVHLIDILLWVFGAARKVTVHRRDGRRIAGTLELERASVRWFFSVEAADLPAEAVAAGRHAQRSLTIDGQPFEFSTGFEHLHTRVYESVLAGMGHGIDDARPAIELIHTIRNTPTSPNETVRLVAGG